MARNPQARPVAEAPDRRKLTKTQAKRLVGKTLEEMSADADLLLEEFGAKPGTGDDEDDDDRSIPRTRPVTKLKNAGDPSGESPNWDVDAAADKYFAASGGVS
jgi:hypothetical protein